MRKLLIIALAVLLSSIAYAQPFGPPLYIANPKTLECRYYFAGDERHFNPRPENFTVNLGYTTEFSGERQACEMYRCIATAGLIYVDKDNKPLEANLCKCPENTFWNETKGCTKLIIEEKKLGLLQRFLNWIKSLFM